MCIFFFYNPECCKQCSKLLCSMHICGVFSHHYSQTLIQTLSLCSSCVAPVTTLEQKFPSVVAEDIQQQVTTPPACHICGTANTHLSCRTKPDIVPCYFVSVGCVIAHSVTCQPLSSEAQLHSKSGPHEHSGTETGSSSSASFFFSHCSISPVYSPFIQSVICH